MRKYGICILTLSNLEHKVHNFKAITTASKMVQVRGSAHKAQ